ncbi:MAG: hypothetical protein OXN86_11285, partial [Chloroflexota bacterium]|nr:hypothetical protein [Chloroflexota bacterium]
GLTLAAATIVAVGLFLATIINTQAASPAEEASLAQACEGLSSGTLSITQSRVSGVTGSGDNGCQVSVTATPPSEGVSGCQVSFTPVRSGLDLSVEIVAIGTCAGVELESSIEVGPTGSTGAGDAGATMSQSHKAVRSQVTAWHYGSGAVPGIKLFWHYAKVAWSYDLNRIYNPSLTTGYWEGGCGWELVSESRRTSSTPTRYFGEHYTNWYADCGPLPDARAASRASVTAKPGGAYDCYGRATFRGGIAGFRYTHNCLVH